MDINTHLKINKNLCGIPKKTDKSEAVVELELTDKMSCDEYQLVHGGFIFGMADYAAMLAVNHPNVVLGKSDMTFFSPSKVGDILRAEAKVTEVKGKKNIVTCAVYNGEIKCAEGTFICFITDNHVLA